MAQIIVNGRKVIDGKVSVSRTLDRSGEEPRLIIQGYLMTKEYIEEIYMIETDRFAIYDVDVFQESFGSEEDDIVYTFVAQKFLLREELDEGGGDDE